ncbi:MAG: TonB-dependent receptor [Bryobacteraceae bacterium]|nr:TonB-dependent receptor [Bryobacteraceae bacterium]
MKTAGIGVALTLVASSLAIGQAISGRLVGTVVDASEAAVPNAQITVTNQGTGIAWTSQTDSQGNYVAPSVPPGSYTVKVEAAGFRAAVVSDNVVSVAQTTRVDVSLQVGAVTETIEVRSQVALVQSTTSDIGETIEGRQIQTLPLNGRIFSQLVQLSPGAVPRGFGDAPESASGAGARTFITSTVNGVPWSGTSFTIDGVANTEPLNAFINIAPPVEAIEEFKVQTNNPSAEFGTFGGAVVNLTLRSGTNEFHGSLFEYVRNQSLNARSFFAGSKAPFKTNQFGGTIGGPIIKNKAFFFGDYQGIRLRNGVTYNINVPTASMRQGILLPAEGFDTIYDPDSATTAAGVTPFPGNSIPVSRWDPVTARVLEIWPQPNKAPSRPGPFQNYGENVSNSQTVNAFDIKGDYQFERAGRLFIRESHARRDLDTVPPANQFMSADPDSRSRNHNAVAGYSTAIRPNLLNELRVGFNRFNTSHFGNDNNVDKNNELGIRNGNLPAFPESRGISGFSVNPLYGFGAPGWTNAIRLANVFELTEGATWVRNSHTFKVGLDLRRIRSTLTNPEGSARGTFTFTRDMTSIEGRQGSEFGSFLLGYPSTVFRGLVNTRPDVRMVQGGAYFQDDWRVSRALTLNLGLRWDIFTHPIENYNRHVNFNPTTGKFNGATDDNRGPNVDTRKTNFAPRAGFAWSPNQGKLAVRGAFGVSYFTDNFGANGGTLERNFPLFQNFSVSASTPFRPFNKLSVDGLPDFSPVPLAPVIDPIRGIQPFYLPQNYRQGTILMWNIGAQRQLGPEGVLEVAYVATRGTNLFRGRNINTPLTPAAGALDPRRPYYAISPLTQNIIERGSNGTSRYNSLQAKYTRRFANGFQGLFSYTYSHSNDNMNVFWVWDDKLNWFPSSSKAIDLRHVFSGSWTYELPFGKGRRYMTNAPAVADLLAGGWSINGIATLRTGEPLSALARNNLLNTGTNNFANVTCSDVGTPKLVGQWFDTACFADPADPYVFGNAKPGTLRGPGVVNFDLSVFKAFRIRERSSLEFRAEFFNAFNNPHFANPVTNRASGDFGRITNTILTPREVQLGMRLLF